MKIANSRVAMASSHELETHLSAQKASITVQAKNGAQAKSAIAAIYESSGESAVSALEQYRKQERKTGEQPPQLGVQLTQSGAHPLDASDFDLEQPEDSKLSLLYQLLEALNGKGKHEPLRLDGLKSGGVLDLRGSRARTASLRAQRFSGFAVSFTMDASEVGTTSAGTLWQRVNATSLERSEREYTAFRSSGYAVTEDGRSIGFDVEFAMSRSFSERFDALSSEQFVLTDPLIINLDSNTTSVSDMKFRFDLDGDGQEENISFAGAGSGFLALDANGNGVIDDGNELFGTRSGNGFADLAAYDGDGNGWIDENDDVYSKLRVWVKDADGGDRLLDLKEANVGAIYLGSADTEFSLKDAATNETNAVLRRTGVYLKETGEAGTLSHVDLRC